MTPKIKKILKTKNRFHARSESQRARTDGQDRSDQQTQLINKRQVAEDVE